MSTALALAFLHARGLDVQVADLKAAVRAALDSLDARYFGPESDLGLTREEARVARGGGLDATPVAVGDDPLLGGVAAYASLVAAGLTTREAARRLGVSDARVRQRLQERTLLAVREGRAWKLPPFQFTAAGEVPGWAPVCAALPRNASPVAVERWLSLPHPDLVVGESPVPPREWLLAGRPPEAVAALAGELG